MEYDSKRDFGNNRRYWNYFLISQTISEQHTREIRNQGPTKENSHIGHCTHSTETTNVEVQNVFHGRNNITCSTDCKYKTAAILYTLETRFVSGI